MNTNTTTNTPHADNTNAIKKIIIRFLFHNRICINKNKTLTKYNYIISNVLVCYKWESERKEREREKARPISQPKQNVHPIILAFTLYSSCDSDRHLFIQENNKKKLF